MPASRRLTWATSISMPHPPLAAITVETDTPHHTAQEIGRPGVIGRAKAECIHERDGASTHGEDVPQDPTHAGRGALERLHCARMIVGFDLHHRGQAVPDIHGAGV